MFTRVVSFTGARDIDAGVEYVRETVAPLLHSQKGFRGTTASADWEGGVFAVLSLWETEADRDASESALLKAREEAVKIVGGHLEVELFEEVVFEAFGLPAVGTSLLVQRVTMDPAAVEDNLAYFRREVLPRITATPGLLAVRQMLDRATGSAIVGTAWTDRSAMEAAAEAAMQRRQQAPPTITFGERSLREIVYIDLP
jgi:heme-degrading monooxygenase HmoA